MSDQPHMLFLPSARHACAAIGEQFQVSGANSVPQSLTLEEVRCERPQWSRRAGDMPYSMFLRGSEDVPLKMGIYWLSHPECGRMCLFLVPRTRDERRGIIRYEVVFD